MSTTKSEDKEKVAFEKLLRSCTDAQVRGIYVAEQNARRFAFEKIAYAELERRGLAS